MAVNNKFLQAPRVRGVMFFLFIASSPLGTPPIFAAAELFTTFTLEAPMTMVDFNWPDQKALHGPKRIPESTDEFVEMKSYAWYWLKLTVDPEWLPPEATPLYALRNHINGLDAVRMQWEIKGRKLEICQTRDQFALKVIDEKDQGYGNSFSERTQAVYRVFRELFTKKDTRFVPLPIPGLNPTNMMHDFNERVASVLIDSNSVVRVGDDGSVHGTELPPLLDLTRPTRSLAESVWWDPTAAKYFWFRRISWWNTGQEIGFYFPKRNGYGEPPSTAEWFPKREPEDPIKAVIRRLLTGVAEAQ